MLYAAAVKVYIYEYDIVAYLHYAIPRDNVIARRKDVLNALAPRHDNGGDPAAGDLYNKIADIPK